MKNVINYFLLMLIVNTTSAQWVQQNSTTTKNLKEVKFVSESTGYIVGDDGVVLKTTNEGSQWDQLETGVADNLTALWLVSSENVFIGTSTGIVLKTIDGGLNWETLNISTDYIYDISFINNNIGFIGTRTSLLRTEDGGENWNEVFESIVPGAKIYEICFASDLVGYALHAGILKTTDGGLNWVQIKDNDSPDYNGADILTSCVAKTNDIVYFGSPYYQGIYKTIDGGQNLTYEHRQVQALDFPTTQIGYAIDSSEGNSDTKIIKTKDGGENWYSILPTNQIYDIHFVNEYTGWLVGANGKILHTYNGGEVPYIVVQEDRITVNPNLSCDELLIEGDFTNYDIIIYDELNNIADSFTGANSPLKINTNTFNDQLYFLSIQHQYLEDVGLQTIITSCNNEPTTSEPQFNLISDTLLTFQYYYDWEGEWPVEFLMLQVVEDVEIENKVYSVFDNLDDSVYGFDYNKDDILDYNFLPFRYDNGNYYELRANTELLVLKDNISIGDTISEEFFYENGDTSKYTFEVIAFHKLYNEFGIDYENVFQVKETFSFTGYDDDLISMHYYSKENGIIRREIPRYVNGTYGPIIFNRILNNNVLIDPPTSINFSIERANSDNNYVTEIKKFSLKDKSANWRLNTFKDISFLSREIVYDLELKNGENIEFGFWFGKGENLNKEEIILEEPTDDLELFGRKWQYKDVEFGMEDFYNNENCDFRITIDNTVIFTNFNSENVELLRLEKAIVNGEEKTYAEFNFDGTAYGWYDPYGEFMNFYKITNASFKGILD